MYKPKLPTNVDPLVWVGPDDPAFQESGLIHCAHIPTNVSRAQPAPVVVMVHGWGGDESVMWLFKRAIPAGVAVIAPRAPYEINAQEFVWFKERGLQAPPESLHTGLDKLEQFIDSLPRLYPVDPTSLALMGFSQGGYMCNGFALTHPFDLIGVASLAGAMPDMPYLERHENLLAGLPVFVAHGKQDETVPLSEAQKIRDAYQKVGADVTYGQYSVGHKMNTQAIQDLKNWCAKLFPKT